MTDLGLGDRIAWPQSERYQELNRYLRWHGLAPRGNPARVPLKLPAIRPNPAQESQDGGDPCDEAPDSRSPSAGEYGAEDG